ncbi:hypothetical protein PC123_g19375 [Phytophthora cactorum]|nr:hypothetical protein PC123_g19375 [Phytophthora cactorum]
MGQRSQSLARWLISDGLPYNIVDFRRLVEVTTGNRDVTILSCDTFNDMLSSSFARFCEMVARLLDIEFRLKFKMPFLNLIHDLWTTGTGKKGVIGTSISFIDSNRDFRHFAMLVRILNYFHESKLVKEMIMSRIAELYGVAIDGMAQFLMSDTAPSTRKVSKLFEDAIPVDYTMYVLNLRLSLQGLFKHVDICQGSQEFGAKAFPSAAALARVWLGRESSNAFQERRLHHEFAVNKNA